VSFSGLPFLLGFLPLALCGFAVAGRRGDAAAKGWLIAMSLLFYGVAAPAFLPLLVLSVAGNFLLLQRMHRSAFAGRWAAFGVAANLAVLGWFKYPTPDPVTPLGLSFFTFTQIGCLLYHAGGDTKPPRAADYALFAAFFPGLTAGPILNPHDMLPQYGGRRWRFDAEDLAAGLGFFIIGLLKKTVLADPLASVVAWGFDAPDDLTLFPAWQAACSYSLQLYFDFSGYSDMAIGLARIFGLRFPDNFDQPYRAPSVIEYWQRWHMSLTRFLMTHVHAPLTLSVLRWRRDHGLPIGAAAQRTAAGFAWMIALPIGMTMALVALWHGSAWTFLVFGALHSAFLLVNHLWRLHRMPAVPRLPGIGLTYVCVLVASVFFRAASLSDAGSVLAGMAGGHGVTFAPDIRMAGDICRLALLYAIVWAAPSTRRIMQGDPPGRLTWRPSPRWAVAMGCAATAGLLAAGGTGEFLYFRF